ncbi:MAG: sensor N-terminal transmembrane domain-containing protein [Hyphomonadaceae bacterium]
MASATGTTRAEAVRAFARSRIARIIFLWNFAGLLVLIVGVLLLTEMRAGLTDAQFRNLRTQGELITNLLIETGTVPGDPYPYINEPAVREVLRRLLPPIAEGARPGAAGPRVRVYADDGRMIADTDVLYDRLEERQVAEEQADLSRRLETAARRVEYLRLTPWRPSISLQEELMRARNGEITRGERLNEKGERVVSVTLPIRRVQAVLGTVTLESADVETDPGGRTGVNDAVHLRRRHHHFPHRCCWRCSSPAQSGAWPGPRIVCASPARRGLRCRTSPGARTKSARWRIRSKR